jgi:hypothetical protein
MRVQPRPERAVFPPAETAEPTPHHLLPSSLLSGTHHGPGVSGGIVAPLLLAAFFIAKHLTKPVPECRTADKRGVMVLVAAEDGLRAGLRRLHRHHQIV